jgi:hypothetical protein
MDVIKFLINEGIVKIETFRDHLLSYIKNNLLDMVKYYVEIGGNDLVTLSNYVAYERCRKSRYRAKKKILSEFIYITCFLW